MTMQILIVFLYASVAVIALLLIGVVLIQPAKSGGMGAAFGGIGESVFGAKAGSHLTKATVVMTTLFFVLTLVLAALIGRGQFKDKKNNNVSNLVSQSAPAAKPQTAPAKKPAAAKPQTAPAKKPAAVKPQTAPAKKPAAVKPQTVPAKKPAAVKPQTAPAK